MRAILKVNFYSTSIVRYILWMNDGIIFWYWEQAFPSLSMPVNRANMDIWTLNKKSLSKWRAFIRVYAFHRYTWINFKFLIKLLEFDHKSYMKPSKCSTNSRSGDKIHNWGFLPFRKRSRKCENFGFFWDTMSGPDSEG